MRFRFLEAIPASVVTLLALSINTTFSQNAEPQIEEISVIGQFVPDEKRGTDQVSNVVGQEQFTRSGDANIAESLKRISGLSTVGGKYVYVRGLGERYSTALMNGAILPSPEPINRVVPMDLFPTAILESVLVQKTYSAAFPAEFGGGVMQMRTKKSTDEFFWNVTSSIGGQNNTTFKDGFTLDGGSRDWLGYDDGHRAMSGPLKRAVAGDNKLKKYSVYDKQGVPMEDLTTIGKAFNNEYTFDTESLPVDTSFTTSFGNFNEIGDSGAKINYFGAIDYSNSWDSNEVEQNRWVPAGGETLSQQEGLDFQGTENSVDLSGMFSVGLDLNENHNVRLTSLLLRKMDHRLSRTLGYIESSDDLERVELEWIERELSSHQLQGDHYFPEFNELVINWRYSDIEANRDSPDHRIYRYDGGELSSRGNGNQRNYSFLTDTTEDFGLDVSMVFYGPANATITTKFGGVISEKDRDSEIRRYGFAFGGPISYDLDLLQQPLETIFAPENIGPEGFYIREITRATDNYTAQNELNAFYGEVEFNFDDRLRFTLGARQEDFTQTADTFDLFNPTYGVQAKLEQDALMPAFSATFINNDHQFRLAYSETVSRPDFRELSPAMFTNPMTGTEVVGNPNLKITDIKNYDFRWEWYFGYTDYVSAGIFYKEFTNPIEASIQSPINRVMTFINAASAENQGVEVEVFKTLDFLGDLGEDFYFQGNVSYIDSTVTIAPEDRGVLTSMTRPLQGQSDWLLNAQIGYEPFSGTTATLLYHYYGDRVSQVGIETVPDFYEQAFGELNFVFIRELNDNWKVTAKAKNITDQRNEVRGSDYLVNGYFMGREISLQVDYTF